MSLSFTSILLAAIFSGTIATVIIDVSVLVLGRVGLPVDTVALLGRWFAYLPRGRLVHHPVEATQIIENEQILGWFMHYLTGVVYAGLYLTLVQGQVTLLSAVVFGLVTVMVPFLILQPGLGLGMFAHRYQRPWLLRAVTLGVHVTFGIGLWLGWLLLTS